MNHMDRDLYLAVFNDNSFQLEELSADWLRVRDQVTPSNNTVLHLACQYKSLNCVKKILRRADESLLLQVNSRGDTALHVAARQGYYDAVEALVIKAKSMVSKHNNLENTSSTILQNLIRATNYGELETALHAAVRYKREDVVELLVKEDPSYSYAQNKYSETPLYLAAVRCYNGVTKVILDNCESPTYGGPHGRTALHAALMNEGGDGYECVRLLLEKNEDLIKMADINGWTAFHYASHNNLYESAEFLLSTNRSVAYLAENKYKRSAIHVAAYRGCVMVLEILLQHLPDAWDSVDGNGQNILHLALKRALTQDQKPLIMFLLSETQRLDAKSVLYIQRDKDGNTPLHLIAKLGYYIPELPNLTAGTDWDVVDDTNMTPGEILYQKHNGTLVDEELVGVTVNRSQFYYLWITWVFGQGPRKDDQESPKEKIDRYRQMASSHMIVTALIATVALTAGFAMPGGFDGNQGPNQGSPVLSKKTTFRIFMVADTVALLFSMSSLFLYFLTSFKLRAGVIFNLLISAVVLNVISIAAMMLAFIAGTYAVLSHSKVLAFTVCIISSLFLLLVFSFCFIPSWRLLRAMKSRLRRFFFAEYRSSPQLWNV